MTQEARLFWSGVVCLLTLVTGQWWVLGLGVLVWLPDDWWQ